MRIKLDDIPQTGFVLDEALPRDFIDGFLPDMQELRSRETGHVQLLLSRQEDDVSVTGTANAELECLCASCLEPMRLALNAKLNLVLFARQPEAPKEEKIEASDEAVDEDDGYAEFDGKIVDWGDIVRQQLLLMLPMAPRCKDDCLGLCPVCGVDRNTTDCQCETRSIDPRWEKLKSIKLAES